MHSPQSEKEKLLTGFSALELLALKKQKVH
jgi:hypothetical protein